MSAEDLERLVQEQEQALATTATARDRLLLAKSDLERKLAAEKAKNASLRGQVAAEQRVVVPGHGRVINRTRVRGRTTSWLSGCKCGWQAGHRVGSRMEAIAQFNEHKADVRRARIGVVVQRAYSPTESES